MDLKFYEMLLAHAKDASQRARWIFTAAIVVALVQAASAYNFSLGQSRPYVEDLILRDGLPKSDKPLHPAFAEAASKPASSVGAESLRELRKAMVKNWVDEQSIDIGLLGTKVRVVDPGPIGPVISLAVMTWLFFAMRREHRLIARILGFAAAERRDTRMYVFHALRSSQMFSSVSDPDEVEQGHSDPVTMRLVRVILWVLVTLPFWALVFVIGVDFASVFEYPAVFRGIERPLHELKGLTPRFYATTGVEIFFTLLVGWLCLRAHQIQRTTEQLLRRENPTEAASGPSAQAG